MRVSKEATNDDHPISILNLDAIRNEYLLYISDPFHDILLS